MLVVFSPELPGLEMKKPNIQFVGGRAEVPVDVWESIPEGRKAQLGLFSQPLAAPKGEETPAPAAEVTPVNAPTAELPNGRASVKEWVAFMKEHEIEHPEDATKAEMKEIAVKHYERRT